ncbi:hypothetical protein GCM10010412_097220 [Nonomuraea recticatena]|uniref:Uncharacterized protein n=1 Tax=Nonomuraea recticatena TaxID=46178 RepID=A0ABN3TF03_9ACTN
MWLYPSLKAGQKPDENQEEQQDSEPAQIEVRAHARAQLRGANPGAFGDDMQQGRAAESVQPRQPQNNRGWC